MIGTFFEKIWYSNSKISYLLLPFSYLFILISIIRKFIFKRIYTKKKFNVSVPIIVVGNINVGGTGKTPLVIYIANFLKKIGKNPAIVIRGYKGKSKGIAIIDKNSSSKEFGDEALLIAKSTNLKVGVGANRRAVLKMLLKKDKSINIIISDDGLQHYKLPRDIEIALCDGIRGFGNGHCLPAGPLRELPKRLRKVDFVVINSNDNCSLEEINEKIKETKIIDCEKNETIADKKTETVDFEKSETIADKKTETVDFEKNETIADKRNETVDLEKSETIIDKKNDMDKNLFINLKSLKNFKIFINKNVKESNKFNMELIGDRIYNLSDPLKVLFLNNLKNRKVHAVSAIGNNNSFFNNLKKFEMDIIEHPFFDHYFFKKEDFSFNDDLPIIITAKDAVKCKDFNLNNIWVYPVFAKVAGDFEKKLIALVKKKTPLKSRIKDILISYKGKNDD